jgi:hypothetical protein
MPRHGDDAAVAAHRAEVGEGFDHGLERAAV